MDPTHRLETIFAHFPGIGPRQARRFVYYLLSKSPSFIKEFTQLIEEVKNLTIECQKCHRFFLTNYQLPITNNHCGICADKSRDQTTLMVVGQDSDLETVEKSGAYRGLYFVLGGTVPILEQEPEKHIRLKSLLERAGQDQAIQEIILSLNTTPEGEHTTDLIEQTLKEKNLLSKIKLTLLGRGLSTGAELEYADGETIKNALNNRRIV